MASGGRRAYLVGMTGIAGWEFVGSETHFVPISSGPFVTLRQPKGASRLQDFKGLQGLQS